MKNLIVLLTAFLISSQAFASYPVGCEMQMLTVVTQTYQTEWQRFGSLFSIKKIEFGFDEKTERGFVFMKGSKSPFESKVCSLKVFMKKPTAAPAPGCPRYDFDEIVESCS